MLTYLITTALLLLSATFSGLNLGLMSLAPDELKRKIKLGNKQAEKIYSVRKDGNFLLVTLLLGNVAANAALSVFLGSITVGLLAIIVSTALITLFGEIIPQAILSRHALAVGSRLIWLVRLFMVLLYPVCRPLAWVLNKTLGEELPTVYSKQELLSILGEHSSSEASDLRRHEEKIASGALLLGDKKIGDAMTPIKQVVSLKAETKTDQQLIDLIKEKGHTRYPVYKDSQDNVIGILNAKDLLGLHEPTAVESLARKPVNLVRADQKLDGVLKTFLGARSHLFVVTDTAGKTVGIITVEDIMEEILQDEIVDEFDVQDNV